MTSRRHVLQWLAAAPVLSACGGNDLPDPLAPWRDPGAGETDPRRFALAHAILAPNPHNTQPWLVEMGGDDEMLLFCDLDRRLPFTDPYDRQITIGCGAFTYLCWMAVLKSGHGCEMSIFPDGAPEPGARLDARPFARLRVAGSPPLHGADPLMEFVSVRRTNRNECEPVIPSATAIDTVASAGVAWLEPSPDEPTPLSVAWETEQTRVATLRDLVWRAFDREMRTRGAQEETYRWLRFGSEERARHRDGLYIDVPAAGLLRAIGMLDEADLLNPDSSANKQAAADWRRKVDTAPMFMWLTTPNDSARSRLHAGMAYVRMNLAAAQANLAMHPWSQALQEYTEMSDLYAEARDTLAVGDRTLQMLFRLGRAAPAEPAARRSLDALLRPASP